jgi:hypothetical protein
LNESPLLLERKCPFWSSKDSVKVISDVIDTPFFINGRVLVFGGIGAVCGPRPQLALMTRSIAIAAAQQQ